MCKCKQIGSIGAHLYVAGRAFSTLCCASLFTYLYSEKGSGKADWLKLFWEETILYQRKQCLSGTSSQRSSKLTGTVPWQKQPAVGQGIAWRWPHRGNTWLCHRQRCYERSLTAPGTKPTMDLRNVPYRSDVLTWEPDDLAEYFRTVSLAGFCLRLMEEQTAGTLVGLNSGIL